MYWYPFINIRGRKKLVRTFQTCNHVSLTSPRKLWISEHHSSKLFTLRNWINVCYTLLSSRLLPKNLKIKIYKTIISPVVLYSCETLSLTLWEVWRLSVFENRILRRIFGPKRDENGEWRRPHNEELHSLYHSPNKFRVIKSIKLRWAGHPGVMNHYRLK